mgnify:CR=1 FL=1
MEIIKGKGQKLWVKAKTLIPTGNQLLSKRIERYLPENWPSYYKKAKGCKVWDLNSNKYYDFAQMGVGSCVLGYANYYVNRAVRKAISNGSMATLNSYEEVELAEKLVSLHAWADMARFSRTGGEACSIAVRIARAASGKDKVAFCGYHGWHDWYISSNIEDSKNLNSQLLTGLKPNGVPIQLKGNTLPFMYNDIDSLKNITENNKDIGVIIMEPQRTQKMSIKFLKEVRKIATKIGAILIFDEVTSGFRINNGGIHLTTGIDPDMAVFGKALGNGFPISAIIGKKDIMTAAQTSFISSTFWTERIGFTAALKTLEIIDKKKIYNNLIDYGNQVTDAWEESAIKNNINIKVTGIPPLRYFTFVNDNPEETQTYYTQEMLKKGFLAGSSVYATNAYSNRIIRKYKESMMGIFDKINYYNSKGNLIEKLEGPVIEKGFKRLN